MTDRIAEARRNHRRGRGGNSAYCGECGKPWPCETDAVLRELEVARGQVRALRQKPNISTDPDVEKRPRLPVVRGHKLDWQPRPLIANTLWAGKAAQALAGTRPDGSVMLLTALSRAACDSEGIASPAIGGSGTAKYEEDGTRTGSVPNTVLAKERIVRNEQGEEVGAHWRVDPVALARKRMLAGVQLMAEGGAMAYESARFLIGIAPTDARSLTTPDSGRCENDACRRWVSGEPGERWIIDSSDGLRRCEACSRYKRRNGHERPEHLCRPDTAA